MEERKKPPVAETSGKPRMTPCKRFCNTLLTRTEVIGLIIGSVSTCSYIGGRCFQIYRNYKRRSVEGVSFLLFLFLVVGNAMYLLGLFLKDPPARRTKADYILAHVSWLLGSGIQLVLDIIIFSQFYNYRKSNQMSLLEEQFDDKSDIEGNPYKDIYLPSFIEIDMD
nr:PREDICTED: lysosomal amino acid transporter 1 homolog [Latimeria chalumnae]|eukprot:XP_014349214.1 PREDICTED: lysosomal amino acid transporter 1 homolog [Latimeria chalumnae]